MASTTAADHQASSRPRGLPRERVSRYTAGSTSTARVAAALTPPMQATAIPDSAAERRAGIRRRAPATSGSSTHGSTASGHASIEIEPSTDSTRGLSV